jgi:CheY-like chemotaxis protein
MDRYMHMHMLVQRWGDDHDPALSGDSAAAHVRHVLVVDDDEDIRWAIRLLMEDLGYVVEEAADGKLALDRLGARTPGMVVLLDMSMPGMDGMQVMQEVAAQKALATRHAYIMVTARDHSLPLVVVKILQTLGVPIVAKPFDIDLLVTAVQAAERVLDTRGNLA